MSFSATSFHFLNYQIYWDNLEIAFNYRIEFDGREPLNFTEKIFLPPNPKKLTEAELAKFLQPLHLMLGISYYKLYCPPQLVLPYQLNAEQAKFWHTVYSQGLGEFLYRNNLDLNIIPEFPVSDSSTSDTVRLSVSDRCLLGIGGGKDSIVAAELLRDRQVTNFLVESQQHDPISNAVIAKTGNPKLVINRQLDQKIFDQHEGAYNGHIPISAVFAFLGLLTAALYEFKYMIVGNEHSSNSGNLDYQGQTINHQWSKTSEFEQLLQSYTRQYITPDITYFSLLRQFYEIRIAKMFSQHEQYFPIFSSCNRNFRVHEQRNTGLWCGECPKCAFTFLLLSPFLTKDKLTTIFGKNLLADDKLLPLYTDILGFGQLKPFDCVGTFEESQAALYLSADQYADDIITKTFYSKIQNPEQLIERVFHTVPALTLPTPFRFYGVENAAILGYGKEGKVSEQYLKQKYPNLPITILDEKHNPTDLENQDDYDLAVKTPGIPPQRVYIPYVTNANLFFSQVNNFTIGVTGSKGKSTTASLIYEMLKAGGKKVRLLGNIGNPMLEVLLTEIDPQEIFVIELSSYMLADIEYSPNIAVLTNLFPEHMNYHGDTEQYYQAKQNIFKWQKSGDQAIKAPFEVDIPVAEKEIPLVGQHNLDNIKAAIAAVRHLNISDEAIATAIKDFQTLPHRLQLVGEFNGIKFYDDAISTAPESTLMALDALGEVETIFLGGEDRGFDFSAIEPALRQHQVINLVLFPESGSKMIQSREGFNILETQSMEEAVKFAYAHTNPGKICLLSTASPSYSLWENFEAKGDEFQKLVRQFAHE